MDEYEDEDSLSLPDKKRKRIDRAHRRDIPEEYLTLLHDVVTKGTNKTLGNLVSR